jgi:hypothetical protein
MEDDFDELRKKSVRTSSVYEEFEDDDEGEGGRPAVGELLRSFSPGQRLILALLLLLNVIAIGVALLVIAGVIRF